MRKLMPLFLGLAVIASCSDDDESTPDIPTPSVIENLVYDELTDGDLSNDSTVPTVITLAPGDNRIVSEQVLGNPDYFTITIPTGYELSELTLEAASSDDRGFIAIAEGTSIDILDDNGTPTAEAIIGGTLFNNTNIDSDILPSIGAPELPQLANNEGFVGALGEGDYTIFLDQLADFATGSTLNFVLTMPEESMPVSTVAYDESIDGDLSSDSTAPTTISLAPGDNRIVSEQVGGNPDYITVTIPTGYELSELTVEAASSDDLGFIGIAEGTSIVVDGVPAATDLLGGSLFNDANIGSDILSIIGSLEDDRIDLEGATGFNDALPTGSYTIFLNQVTQGVPTGSTLNFVLTMP